MGGCEAVRAPLLPSPQVGSFRAEAPPACAYQGGRFLLIGRVSCPPASNRVVELAGTEQRPMDESPFGALYWAWQTTVNRGL